MEDKTATNDDAVAVPAPQSPFPLSPHIFAGQILAKRPGSSVWGMRRVCREWRSLIENDSHLIKEQLKHAKAWPLILLDLDHNLSLVNPRDHRSMILSKAVLGPELTVHLPSGETQAFSELPGAIHWIRSSCSGLLCVEFVCMPSSGLAPQYSVVNPATGQVLALPYNHVSADMELCQLVYDPSCEAHKLLLLFKKFSRYQCMIITLCAGALWRILGTIAELDGSYLFYQSGLYPCVNGSMHWLSLKNPSANGGLVHIVAFDIAYETFRIMTFPNCCLGDNVPPHMIPSCVHTTCLVEIEGFLYLMHVNDYGESIDMWVMEDYANEVWTRRYRVSLTSIQRGLEFGFSIFPLAKTDGEIILCLMNVRNMFTVSFKLQSRTFTNLHFLGLNDHLMSCVGYVDSLVKLPVQE